MIVLLCIDYFRKPVNWNYPFLPRIGEKLFTADFLPHEELKEPEDYLVVTDVIWHRENTESKELCVSLLLDYQK
ncbi:hypothetical protein [Chryseobacterium pennae]|nr:hypothetical protein [Chryseobacterium pennae]